MGAGASAGLAAATSASDSDALKAVFTEIGPENCQKIKAALESMDEKPAAAEDAVKVKAAKMSLLWKQYVFEEEAAEGSLHRAAAAGDVEALQKLVGVEGVDLETTISWSWDTAEDFGGTSENTDKSSTNVTALHIAVDRGHAECVKLLVEAGAKVTAKCKINDCDEDDTVVEMANLAAGKPDVQAALGIV